MMVYIGDLKKDPAFCMCSLTAKGFWWEMLMAMHENNRCGVISGTPEDLARVAGCYPEEAAKCIAELAQKNVAIVEPEHESVTSVRGGLTPHPNTRFVTLVNRRMKREHDARNGGYLRVKKHRDKNGTFLKRDCNADDNAKVTSIEHQPSFSSSSSKEQKTIAHAPRSLDFEALYRFYPRKKGKALGIAICKNKIKTPEQYGRVRAGIQALIDEAKQKGTELEFLPYFSTYMRQQRWEDEPELQLGARASPPPGDDVLVTEALERERREAEQERANAGR